MDQAGRSVADIHIPGRIGAGGRVKKKVAVNLAGLTASVIVLNPSY